MAGGVGRRPDVPGRDDGRGGDAEPRGVARAPPAVRARGRVQGPRVRAPPEAERAPHETSRGGARGARASLRRGQTDDVHDDAAPSEARRERAEVRLGGASHRGRAPEQLGRRVGFADAPRLAREGPGGVRPRADAAAHGDGSRRGRGGARGDGGVPRGDGRERRPHRARQGVRGGEEESACALC